MTASTGAIDRPPRAQIGVALETLVFGVFAPALTADARKWISADKRFRRCSGTSALILARVEGKRPVSAL